MKAAEAEKADWLAKQNQAEAEKEKLAGELEASEKAYSEILNFSRQKWQKSRSLSRDWRTWIMRSAVLRENHPEGKRQQRASRANSKNE